MVCVYVRMRLTYVGYVQHESCVCVYVMYVWMVCMYVCRLCMSVKVFMSCAYVGYVMFVCMLCVYVYMLCSCDLLFCTNAKLNMYV